MTDALAVWLAGNDTGTSSKTIASVIFGFPLDRYSVPLDPDDFGRCHRLMQAIPETKERLSLVVDRFPEWGPLVREWEKLTALYNEESPKRRAPKLYAEMQRLIKEGEKV